MRLFFITTACLLFILAGVLGLNREALFPAADDTHHEAVATNLTEIRSTTRSDKKSTLTAQNAKLPPDCQVLLDLCSKLLKSNDSSSTEYQEALEWVKALNEDQLVGFLYAFFPILDKAREEDPFGDYSIDDISNLAFQRLTNLSPKKARALIEPSGYRDQYITILATSWSRQEPSAALDWFDAFSKKFNYPTHLYREIYSNYAEKNYTAARDRASNLEGYSQMVAFAGIIDGLPSNTTTEVFAETDFLIMQNELSSDINNDYYTKNHLTNTLALKWAKEDFKAATTWYIAQSPENRSLLNINQLEEAHSTGFLDDWYLSYDESFLNWAQSEGKLDLAAAHYLSYTDSQAIELVLKYFLKESTQDKQQQFIKAAYTQGYSYASRNLVVNKAEYFKQHLRRVSEISALIKDSHLIKEWLEEQIKEAERSTD